MPFLLAFWKPIAVVVGVVILLATLGVAKHHYDNGKRDEGRVEVQAKWDDEKARAKLAVAEQETKFNAERDRAEKAEQERDHERQLRSDAAAAAARSLPAAVSHIVVPRAATRVLNNAIDAGHPAKAAGPSSSPAKEAAVSAESADSTVGLLTEWGVACINAYDEARGMVSGWQEFYSELQKAQ